ncbi:4-hydroxythreonine-4-phosphate dehydrogenase [Candidatus Blochmanniella vafra str. BVAF]|uniref:4-hydroxythreonine-4-phosphate dehydrogenase n=1 Tax=Blochmanniella vafra (strain BVAF) TaxID=859654 RepID=E8Q5N8_BLOVB|nr:4-hydroxythreonine-4-phosphate dehydrogenase PdxA [Candidatus Blochmannia vafer]ADV33535.1 4-hydroxythreonine-4-phosphate dehydrogenase [Candidatus Blochmannia vafer str. BVAF]
MIQFNANKPQKIIITPGEPSGVGPDIVIMTVQKKWPIDLIICADSNLLLDRAKTLNLPLTLVPYYINNTTLPFKPGKISILDMSLSQPVIPGQLNVANNNYIINTLNRAATGCINGEFSALVTGPINKSILNKGGISFSGHTEFLAKISKTNTSPVMMLSNNKLNVALVTTHIPIALVSQFITQQTIHNTITTLVQGLQKYFNISNPTIYVCGLNPHSGESGYIGSEEITTIIPALNNLRKTNMNCNIIGPFPADTIFQTQYLRYANVILAMYHDQGLPVLKFSGFGKSVNITFGLPFIRTSVDHGSALKLAGLGIANNNSMTLAIKTAINMIKNAYNYAKNTL